MARLVVQGNKSQGYLFSGKSVRPKQGNNGSLMVSLTGGMAGQNTRVMLGGMDITPWVQSFDLETSYDSVPHLTLRLTNVEMDRA